MSGDIASAAQYSTEGLPLLQLQRARTPLLVFYENEERFQTERRTFILSVKPNSEGNLFPAVHAMHPV